MRSSLSWLSWHIGQMRTWPLLPHVLTFWEVLSASLINSAEVWGPFVKVGGSSLWLTPVESDTSAATSPSLSVSSLWRWSFSWSKSDSASDPVHLLGFSEASRRHWSMWLLKTFRSFVSTLLKHTGQSRLSDTLPPHPDVDATASARGGQRWSSGRSAVELSLCWGSVGGSALVVALYSGSLAFISCSFSRRAWALWKKDCWGSSSVFSPSDLFCFLQRRTSSGFWPDCTGSRQARGLVWTEWLRRWSFSCFWLLGITSSESVLPCWRKPMMLLCWGLLSSELTNAEILTPTSAQKQQQQQKIACVTDHLDLFQVRHSKWDVSGFARSNYPWASAWVAGGFRCLSLFSAGPWQQQRFPPQLQQDMPASVPLFSPRSWRS